MIPHLAAEFQTVVAIRHGRYNCGDYAGSGQGMGIRFYCPNGHKLNVKDFQAGRKGICPVCGVKMQIPLESTRPSSRDEESQSEGN